jgi:hypothetical protein
MNCENINANDVAYWRLIVDEAEQFFNRTIQVSINRIYPLAYSIYFSISGKN